MSPASSRAVVIAAIAALGAGALLAGCAAVSSSEPHAAAATRAPEAEWFVKTGCTACHSISVYDIWSVAATGPDLSVAAEDVPRRFGRSLEDFLRAPTGTMALVLAGRIPLDDEQRAVAAGKLRDAHRRYRELNSAGRPAASH
ncbi:MAG TPA: hypothetical protein VL263_05025 [Vicinamibacterales bacterium]|jgi:hypothetical protein|nr:hypothetical protein [Vicinamibacterales bacterium]